MAAQKHALGAREEDRSTAPTSLEVLSQNGFAGWGFVLLSFLKWRDVVTRLAATCKTFRTQLKANFPLPCVHYWRQASACGWQRITEAYVYDTRDDGKPSTFPPPEHLQKLICRGVIQTASLTTPDDARTVCPNVRNFRVVASWDQRQDREWQVKNLTRTAQRLAQPKLLTALELWQYVVDNTSWSCAMPKITGLALIPELSQSTWNSEDFAYTTSVLMSACFGREAFALPLQRLELEIPLPNDAVSVHIMTKLAPSLRSLRADLVVQREEGKHKKKPGHLFDDEDEDASTWLWDVPAWPELRELDVSWQRWDLVQPMTRVNALRRLHAPHLHTLRVDACADGSALLTGISPQTRRSLRNLTVRYHGVSELVLGDLPESLTHLRLRVRAVDGAFVHSLPTGLHELVIDDTVALWSRAPEGTKFALPELRRVRAAPAILGMIDAPRLREVVWSTTSENLRTCPNAATLREALAHVAHVTFVMMTGDDVPCAFQPWVTRVQIEFVVGVQIERVVDDDEAPEERGLRLCERLEALHLPDPTSQAEVDCVRNWARKRGLQFSLRECSVDDR